LNFEKESEEMKNKKLKLLCLMLAVMMVFSMTSMVLAIEDTKAYENCCGSDMCAEAIWQFSAQDWNALQISLNIYLLVMKVPVQMRYLFTR